MSHNWQQIFAAPGGRRYFYNTLTGVYSFADDSGETPADTDDARMHGILAIHRDDVIKADPMASGGRGFTLCVHGSAGQVSHLGMCPEEALGLANVLDMELETCSGFRFRRVGAGR